MYTAIVKVESNRVTKFVEFDSQEDAQSHCDNHGGFVYAGSYSPELYVEGQTVTIQEVVLPPVEFRESIKTQIDKIERDDLMNRRAREAFILQAEQIASTQYGLTPEQLYAVNPGYKGAKDVDNEVKALRALL